MFKYHRFYDDVICRNDDVINHMINELDTTGNDVLIWGSVRKPFTHNFHKTFQIMTS